MAEIQKTANNGPTEQEVRIQLLEKELKELKKEWDNYKKLSPFYKQVSTPILKKQRPR